MADMVVPCNASFNTAWEIWLGTREQRMMPLLNALEIEHYPCLQVRVRSPHAVALFWGRAGRGPGGGGRA